ncbi:hypothetical protein XO10_05885 [Marinitoga sp. 1135]|uniref:hypothetical protein n=1 Tax=Marinitoga sp. 1135 TaxID=1643333 RepID=UPI0015867BDC|nr:hypothetical protein [Marinitoga sp. 1135]NUU95810.1 hypothetical protein [Marinitoga sp. 1135]
MSVRNVNSELKKILDVVNICKEIKGRKKFQKIIYILKNLGVDFPEKFTYHYYGPYSQDLQLELDELVELRYLNEELERKSYKYTINYNEIVDDKIDTQIMEKEKVINYLNSLDAQTLELIATLFYLHNDGLRGEKYLKNKTKILKPHLKSKLDKAFEEFNKLLDKKF